MRQSTPATKIEKSAPKVWFVDKEYDPLIEEALRLCCKRWRYCNQEEINKIDADILVSSSLDLLSRAKEEGVKVCAYFGPKDAEALARAINSGVDRFILASIDSTGLCESFKELESLFFLRRAKEYNVFMLHQYKNAIDSSNIVSKTDVNGIITYVNEEFCKISGYSKEELIGKNHNIVRHPDVPKEHFKRFWERILAKKIWKGTVKNRAKDGSTFYVNTTVIPILDHKGTIAEFVAIRYDVTKSVQLQERLQKKEKELEALNKELEARVLEKTKELQELNRTLERRVIAEVRKNREKDRVMFQQARLAALGEMLGNIAHQWRQPLMELGLLFYKIKKVCKDDQVAALYKKGVKILEQMSQTIVDFQNFFSPTKQKELFSPADRIEQTLSILEGSLQRANIRVEKNLQPDLFVYGYPNEFSQVILNILNNAKEALTGIQGSRHIWIKAFEDEEALHICIEDNGTGVPKDIMEKIFEPYFSTKSKGTGLGLYMSKMIIEQSMEGTLEVSNTKSGAKFIIKLPKGKRDGM